jgi:hypothetical protein
MSGLSLISVLLGCAGDADDGAKPEVEDTSPEELVLPDLTGVDLPVAYEGGLRQALAATAGPAWAANLAALDLRHEGCPDLYAGPVEELELDEDAAGLAWADHCQTEGGLSYDGAVHWQGDLALSGDPHSD